MSKMQYYRIMQGLQLKDLVLSTGISMGHISHLENGTRQPSRKAMDLIAKALNKTVPEVFYDDLTEDEAKELEAKQNVSKGRCG